MFNPNHVIVDFYHPQFGAQRGAFEYSSQVLENNKEMYTSELPPGGLSVNIPMSPINPSMGQPFSGNNSQSSYGDLILETLCEMGEKIAETRQNITSLQMENVRQSQTVMELSHQSNAYHGATQDGQPSSRSNQNVPRRTLFNSTSDFVAEKLSQT